MSIAFTLNGGFAITKSNLPARVVEVVVVGVRLADVAFEAVDGQVHPAQLRGLRGLLLPVDRELFGRVLLVLVDEARALDEHAAGAAGRIEDAPVERLDDLDDQADDGAGREELAALLPLGERELAEEVLVDAAERVVVERPPESPRPSSAAP